MCAGGRQDSGRSARRTGETELDQRGGMIICMHTTAIQRLRTEMMRRMNDDWHLDGDIRPAELWMRHLVKPPAWRLALDEAGQLHRRTSGSIPSEWLQLHPWEAPDGPVAP